MSKNFSEWHKIKTFIDAKETKIYFHPREVWWCSVGLNVGFEQDGKNRLYERPVLVLKVFNQNLLLAVPLTSRLKSGIYYHTIEHDGDKSSVILSQVRLISSKRLHRKIRTIPKEEFKSIQQNLANVVLDIKNDPLAGVSEAEAISNGSIAQSKSLSSQKKLSIQPLSLPTGQAGSSGESKNVSPRLSLEPYKGTRDFYPRDQFVQNYIFGVWRRVAESFGYLEYDASILEETDLYRAKSGEEIISEQTYSFTDRGGRDVTIRPEMTPTVARMVAQKRKELTFPLRWFSMPNLFRYERPQRGRLREHWQLNVDMFGVDGVEADVEVIAVAHGIMKAFGASDEAFEIRVNDRRLLNFLLHEHLQLTDEQAHKISKLIDKMKKMKAGEFLAEATDVIGEKATQLETVLYVKSLDELGEKVPKSQGAHELQVVFKNLENLGIKNFIYDPSVVRGFDYYTGVVFEVYDLSPVNNRSVFGGGRYDDLVSIFGVEKVSGCGFGAGDVTIRDFLETHSLLPEYRPPVKLYICHLENYLESANILAADLRKAGINVAVDLTSRQVTKQIKTADKEQIPYILVVGEEETKTGQYKLKNLKESKELLVEKARLAKYLL